MPATGGVHNAIVTGHAIGCTAVQVFTSSPQMWKSKPVTDEMVATFKNAQRETGITEVVSHDSYLINLCAPDDAKRKQSMEGIKGEIERCALYGIDRVVSHMGAHMGQGEECGLQGIAESIKQVLDETPDSVTVLMETTAGQGSSLMARFEHHAWILDALKGHPRLGVCLDTCHIFAAGYDIRTRETFTATFAEFDRLIGFDRLKTVHCNDSKKGLGTRVDRHAHLGEGEIGDETFRLLVTDERFNQIPILLETAHEDDGHVKDLQKLKAFAGSTA